MLAFSSRRGPKPDVDEFKDLVSVAARRVKLRCIVADAGYDSESNHQFARESLASRSIFPAKHGRPTSKPASGKYRRLMQVRFDRKTYRKRVQVETVVSMIKRRLGNHVRARSRWGQVRELALVVLTHNLMILWCSILFYKAVPDTNGTVENNIVFLRGFFEQLGFEYVSGLEHEFVSVSPPLED
ncbi:MAG: transposase, partial [bacterium]